jgi:hypothetical protein
MVIVTHPPLPFTPPTEPYSPIAPYAPIPTRPGSPAPAPTNVMQRNDHEQRVPQLTR